MRWTCPHFISSNNVSYSTHKVGGLGKLRPSNLNHLKPPCACGYIRDGCHTGLVDPPRAH